MLLQFALARNKIVFVIIQFIKMRYKDRDCNIGRIITAEILVSNESLSIIMFFLVYLLAIFPLLKYK